MNTEGKETDTNYLYNGFSFVYYDNLWYTQAQVKLENETLISIPLHFGARELEDVNVIGIVDNKFDKNEVYITFDPEEADKYIALAAAELSLNLATGIKVTPIAACTKPKTQACEDRPIVNCFNKDKAVILLKKTEYDARVIKKENCVELSGKDEEIIKATDRLLLEWYGIMNDEEYVVWLMMMQEEEEWQQKEQVN